MLQRYDNYDTQEIVVQGYIYIIMYFYFASYLTYNRLFLLNFMTYLNTTAAASNFLINLFTRGIRVS